MCELKKNCKECNIEKELSEFKFIKNKYYLNYCKKCCYLKSNKETTKNYNKIWFETNKELNKEKRKKYNDLNKDKLLEYSKEYYNKNKKKQLESGYKRHKERLSNDLLYNLKYKIRTTIKNSFRHTKTKKSNNTLNILGCSFEDLKIHLESKFEPWMNWDNRGKYNGDFNYGWDIDHIIPIATAVTVEDVIKLNHYTNLQPLCSKTNRDIKKDNLEY